MLGFNERVMVQMALSAKRREYFDNWLEARRPTSLGDAAYWAECIERVNDAAEAVSNLGLES